MIHPAGSSSQHFYGTALQARGKITSVSPLVGVTKLGVLYLEDNQISDISPRMALTSLSRLDLRGNPLSPEACDIYIPQMRTTYGIDVVYDQCVVVPHLEWEVPDVVGMSQTDAAQMLTAAGFTVWITAAPSGIVPTGHVISQDPADGTMVSIIDPAVTLTISTGPGGTGPVAGPPTPTPGSFASPIAAPYPAPWTSNAWQNIPIPPAPPGPLRAAR